MLRRSLPLSTAFPAAAGRVCVTSRPRQLPFASHWLGRAPSLWSALRCQSSSLDYYSLPGVSLDASATDMYTAYEQLVWEETVERRLAAHAALSSDVTPEMCQVSNDFLLLVLLWNVFGYCVAYTCVLALDRTWNA